jgi:hypothetical protein
LDDSEGQYVTYINPSIISKDSTQFLQSGVINKEAFNNTLISAAASKISLYGSKRFRAYVSPSTAHNCEAYMRQLYNCFVIIGDYMSMLILLDFPPLYSPPMKPLSILMFVYHRMESPGTPLFLDHHKSKMDPLKDVFDAPVLSEGLCRSKGGLLHLFQPISVLHRMQKLKGEYLEPCDDCVAAHQLCIKEGRREEFEKCANHQFNPTPIGFLLGHGDPIQSEEIIVGKLAMDKLE